MSESSDRNVAPTGQKKPNVGLLITCLADLFRPSVGFAAVKLLENAGCRVHVPEQTCCGQPAYNAGARDQAQAMARRMITDFEAYDYVVAPSGSCAGMAAMHYPELFHGDPVWSRRARDLARRTFELTSFLTDVLKIEMVASDFAGTATYHDSCAGLREMNVKQQPRKLLDGVGGLTVRELPDAEVCCGFGGTFCIKYDEISLDIVERKIDDVIKTGADTLLAGDLGCLLNMAGALKRRGSSIEVRHVAEVLADMTDEVPPIGEDGGGEL
jgi:L-lactate dehydrogenase complex protein LldE